LLLLLLEEFDLTGRIGKVVLAREQPERTRAVYEDIQPAILQALEILIDLACTADGLQLLVRQPDDAELALDRAWLAQQALLDHAQIAILEDVQRHGLAGQCH